MRKVPLTLILMITLLVSAATACAQEEEESYEHPEELFQGEIVFTEECGELQVTLSPSFIAGHGSNHLHLPLAIEYGLTDALEIEAEWKGAIGRYTTGESDPVYGIGDVALGAKYSFMSIYDSDLHCALGLEIGFPTGDVEKELSEGSIEYEPYLVVAADLPGALGAQLFTQLGFGFAQRVGEVSDEDAGETEAHELRWNTGFYIPLDAMMLTFEATLETDRWNNDGEKSSAYLTPGLTWQPADEWEIGLGVPVGMTSGAERFGCLVNITQEF